MRHNKVNVQMLEPQATNGIRTIDTTKPICNNNFWRADVMYAVYYTTTGDYQSGFIVGAFEEQKDANECCDRNNRLVMESGLDIVNKLHYYVHKHTR